MLSKILWWQGGGVGIAAGEKIKNKDFGLKTKRGKEKGGKLHENLEKGLKIASCML